MRNRFLILWLMLLLGIAEKGFAASATIVITGRTQGILEPCGCQTNIKGGLEARAAYLAQLRSKPEPFALIDLGGFMPSEAPAVKSEGSIHPQDGLIDRALGLTNLAAYKQLGYEFVVLGPGDLAQGYEVLHKASNDFGIPFLSADLTSKKETFWKSSFVKKIGDAIIGFIGVTSFETNFRRKVEDFGLSDASQAISREAEKLRKESSVDAVVVLVHEPFPLVNRWLTQYPGAKIDLVVMLDFGITVSKIKETFLANAPEKGYSVGLIRLEIEKGKGVTNVSFDRIKMAPQQFKNKPMRDFLTQSYERMVKEHRLKKEGPFVLQNLPEEQDPSQKYSGAESCRECHQEPYKQWKQSPHAVAFDSLLERNRHWVPECVMCHVTGFGNPAGYRQYPQSNTLRDVQCETCHGPGRKHVDEMGTGEIRRTPPKELCLQGHDKKNSPKFEELFDLYYKKVTH